MVPRLRRHSIEAISDQSPRMVQSLKNDQPPSNEEFLLRSETIMCLKRLESPRKDSD
jgi:hypothetical protein